MSRKKFAFVSLGVLSCVLASCASPPPRSESITAYRTFEVPKDQNPKLVADAVKTAMSVRASNLMSTVGVVAENLPDKPGSFDVAVQQMSGPFGMGMSFPRVSCGNAYAVISNSGGFASGGTTEMEAYTGCVYPYNQGTKIDIVLIATTQHQNGIQGMVNQAVKGLITGSNQETAEQQLDQITAKLNNVLPQAKLIRQSK